MERPLVSYSIPVRDARAADPLEGPAPAHTELLSLAITSGIEGECSRCLKSIRPQELACLAQFRERTALKFHYGCYRAWDDAW